MPGFRPFCAALMLCPTLALAQVGHDPASSPYRDLSRGSFLAPQVSFFQGSGGIIGIVPNSGMLFGARADILGHRALSLGLEFATGTLERLIVDADDPVATRVKGPVDQGFGSLGINLLLNLTGTKTWRGLAPYVGTGVGLAKAGKVVADTSGWDYGTRFYFAPTAGVRVFLGRDIFLRLEARSMFAQVTYPASYREEPSKDPGTSQDPHAVLANRTLKEWVTSGIYTIGLGIPFPWPF